MTTTTTTFYTILTGDTCKILEVVSQNSRTLFFF